MSEHANPENVIGSLPQVDKNTVESVIKDLMKGKSAEYVDEEINSKNAVDKNKAIEVENFDEKDEGKIAEEILAEESRKLNIEVDELTRTSITERMTDDASGYDFGLVEKLKEKIKDGHQKGLNVSHLEEKLSQIISDRQRELENNADNQIVDVDQEFNENTSYFDDDGEESFLEEAKALFGKLAEIGALKLMGYMNGDKDNESSIYAVTAYNSDIYKMNEESYEKTKSLAEEGLKTCSVIERDSDGNIESIATSTAFSKFYKGERNREKISKSDIEENNRLIRENPEHIEVVIHAVGNEETVVELARKSEEMLLSKYGITKEAYGKEKSDIEGSATSLPDRPKESDGRGR